MAFTQFNLLQTKGHVVKKPVVAVTTSDINLSAAPNSVDGVSLTILDRILVTGQTTASQNGIYYVTTLGTGSNGVWTRAVDANTSGDMFSGVEVYVSKGTTNAKTTWTLTTQDPITLDTTGLTFEKLSTGSGSGGGGGITSLNTQTGTTQSFQTGTSGTDFNISSNGDVHTFNIPDASVTARGMVSTGSQTFSGNKIFNDGFNDLNSSLFIDSKGATTYNSTTDFSLGGSSGSNFRVSSRSSARQLINGTGAVYTTWIIAKNMVTAGATAGITQPIYTQFAIKG